MKTFHYTALNAANTYVKGKVQARSTRRAMLQVEALQLLVITLKPEVNARLAKYDQMLSRITRLDKIFFTSHLYTLLESGIALDHALRITSDQASNQKFKAILIDIYQHVQKGQSFNSALALYPQHFTGFYINLIRVGETSGNLVDVLFHLLEQQEKDYELLVKARGAMIYPSIIIAALFGIITVMMVFVIPSITALLLEYKVQLPLATRVLIWLSSFVVHWGWALLPVLLVLVWLLRRYLKTPAGQWYWDGFLLHVPKLRQIVIEFNLARFARATSSLLKSGVQIDQALLLAANVTNNSHYQKSIRKGVGFIQKGIPLAEVLRGYPDLYPPIANRMIDVGERTGRLDHMLTRLAQFYEKSVTNALGNISSIIEPVLLILIGLSVGFVAIAILTPIWKFSQTV